ncbi:GTP-binding protein [Candidatus Woesearchaeota archaeon]|nr:GTP-binding protein [Candidatus Woesearchaeota archaeon]
MNFQTLMKVEDSDFFIDLAFRNAKTTASMLKLKGPELEKTRTKELKRIETIKQSINKSVGNIIRSFPNLEDLPEFYYELVKISLDYVKLKKSLGAVNWVVNKVNDFSIQYRSKIIKTQSASKMRELRGQYYGRVASALKQIKSEFAFLEYSRRIMKRFPTVKTSVPSVVVIGFPNVGKTTLLFKLTGSKPEINTYAFTTKTINVSYFTEGKEKIQVLDTPGSLNRFEKMNDIEKQADLALKHCSDLIVYVLDPTEEYSLKDQKKLLLRVKKTGRPIITFLTKTDLVEKKIVKDYVSKFSTLTDIDELKKQIVKKIKPKE